MEMGLVEECEIVVRPSGEYRFEGGLAGIHGLGLRRWCVDPEMAIESELQTNLNKLSIGCAGSILVYLDMLQDENIRGLSLYGMNDSMQISEETLYALGIFSETGFKSKGGADLFGMYRGVTGMSEKKMKMWFLKPLQSVGEIVERQKVVSYMIKNGSEVRSAIKGVGNIVGVMNRLRSGTLVNDWCALIVFLKASSRLIELCKSVEGLDDLNNVAYDRLDQLNTLLKDKVSGTLS